MKQFDVYCADYREGYYEDPKCPWEWRGSGCYDISVYSVDLFKLEVYANSEEQIADVVKKWSDAQKCLGYFDVLWSEVSDDSFTDEDFDDDTPFVDGVYWREEVLGPSEEEEDDILSVFSKEQIKNYLKGATLYRYAND